MAEMIYAIPNVQTPNAPVIIDPSKCTGCNTCVEICQIDVFIPNPKEGEPPIILHPEECWYCGCCMTDCPTPDAIKLNYPLPLKPRWRTKASGEIHTLK